MQNNCKLLQWLLKQEVIFFATNLYYVLSLANDLVFITGFSSLVLDSTHSRLFAGCTNDNIYMYSCTALGQEPLGTFSGHLNSTFYVKAALSPNDMYLVSGSSDNNAYIWRVTDPSAPPIVLKGHLGEVTSVAWCPSDQGKVCTVKQGPNRS